jgi:hypothetical protein
MVSKNESWLSILIILFLAGCNDQQQERNGRNLKRIKQHMSIVQVKSIMGSPDSILTWPTEDGKFRYLYLAPVGMSDNFYIIFSSQDSTVISTVDGS